MSSDQPVPQEPENSLGDDGTPEEQEAAKEKLAGLREEMIPEAERRQLDDAAGDLESRSGDDSTAIQVTVTLDTADVSGNLDSLVLSVDRNTAAIQELAGAVGAFREQYLAIENLPQRRKATWARVKTWTFLIGSVYMVWRVVVDVFTIYHQFNPASPPVALAEAQADASGDIPESVKRDAIRGLERWKSLPNSQVWAEVGAYAERMSSSWAEQMMLATYIQMLVPAPSPDSRFSADELIRCVDKASSSRTPGGLYSTLAGLRSKDGSDELATFVAAEIAILSIAKIATAKSRRFGG